MKTLLIANRGAIASRIIRTCQNMGIRAVAVFSDADRESPYVKQADVAICIGPSTPTESYLNQKVIIDAAKSAGADAIHPGYGFLSENAEFASNVESAGLIFIGPRADIIQSMGSKADAKSLMQANNIPTIPGYQGADQSISCFEKESERIGYPILIKASAGGGGRGMRIVENREELASKVESAFRESLSAFGDGTLIIEKYIGRPRHIEVQVLGDNHGNVIHLHERECTIQRRHQKIFEESPSPVLSSSKREEICQTAVKVAKALNYNNAGTVEFLYDEEVDEFYFLEMNTRLQVEHAITEEITGLDLVQFQIEVAGGMTLDINQQDINPSGYAAEVRLYAEDPTTDFMPCSGTVTLLEFPQTEGIRIESSIASGSEVSIFYDPMLAKIIVHDRSRRMALHKLSYFLDRMVCLGLKTNQKFLSDLLRDHRVLEGAYTTNFLAEDPGLLDIQTSEKEMHLGAIAAFLLDWNKRNLGRRLLISMPSGWRNNFTYPQETWFEFEEELVKVKYRVSQQSINVQLSESAFDIDHYLVEDDRVYFEIDNTRHHYRGWNFDQSIVVKRIDGPPLTFSKKAKFPINRPQSTQSGYVAQMPSQVVKVLVQKNQQVNAGDELIVISSMKMESTIEAFEEGTVEEVYVSEGQNIEAGYLLLKMK